MGDYYMALSHKDWELQIHEFDWLKSSHLERHLDR